MRILVFTLVLGWAVPALAQYQVDPTHLYPVSSNTSPARKGPPKNRVISTQDRQKAIPLHKADKFYPINQSKPISITSFNKGGKPVTIWKNTKKPGYKPSYPSLYQDPAN